MGKIKAGIIGCGMISEVYIRNLTTAFSNVDVVACADIILSAAQKRAAQFKITAMTPEELLANEEIELVLNLTVPDQHAAVSMAVLQAGKHVYSEKPLATCLEDARELVRFAALQGLLIGCAPDTFMGGGLQTCRKLIDEGAIGMPVGVQAFMLSQGPESFHANPDFFYKKGAGPLMDWGPYYLTAMVFLLGPVRKLSGMGRINRPVRMVLAEGSPRFGEMFTVEVPSYVSANMEFENGCMGHLTTTFDLHYGYLDSDMPFIRIYGTEGTLTVPDTNQFDGPVILRKGAHEPEEVPLQFGFTENFRGMGLSDMANAIETGEDFRPSGDLALHVTEVMLGILESAESGQVYNVKSSCRRPEPMQKEVPEYLCQK